MPLDWNPRLSRRGFLAATGIAASCTLAPRAAAGLTRARTRGNLVDAPASHSFVSRLDLQPPTVAIVTPDAGSTEGHVLLAPFNFPTEPPSTLASGPLIIDRHGQPLWFKPLTGPIAMDVHVQRYRGEPVLTWWEGTVFTGYGGSFVIVDSAYRPVGRVRAGNGYKADLHEIVITSRNTALVSIYNEIHTDLSRIGGATDGRLVEGVIQEIDVASGRVLFEWHSLDHIALEESFELGVTKDGNVDYFHLNSIGVDTDGHLLISARNTSAVYKLHRRTGRVIWRLGGKQSSFALAPGLAFAYQHDARRHSDGTITVFDNAASRPTEFGIVSRALRIRLDERARTASLARDYPPPETRTAWAMGNAQQVGDGGLFVGWGTFPGFSEIGPDGTVRFDARFVGGSVSYRVRRQPWTGLPATPPAVATAKGPNGSTVVYMSWNGATEVAHWELRVGSSSTDLRRARTVPRRGFETAVALGTRPRYVAVAALDRRGALLGTSQPIRA